MHTGGQTLWVNSVSNYEYFRWAAAGKHNIPRVKQSSGFSVHHFSSSLLVETWSVLICRHSGHQLPVSCIANTSWQLQHQLPLFTAHSLSLSLMSIKHMQLPDDYCNVFILASKNVVLVWIVLMIYHVGTMQCLEVFVLKCKNMYLLIFLSSLWHFACTKKKRNQTMHFRLFVSGLIRSVKLVSLSFLSPMPSSACSNYHLH